MESKNKDEEQTSQKDIIINKILHKYEEIREFINEIGVDPAEGVLCFVSYWYADLFLLLKYDEKEIDRLVKVCRNSGKKMSHEAVKVYEKQ